jgi:pentatricopeptide repeat protein
MIQAYASRGNTEAVQKWTTELCTFSMLDSRQLGDWMRLCVDQRNPDLALRYFHTMTQDFKVVPDEPVYYWLLSTFEHSGKTQLLEYPKCLTE